MPGYRSGEGSALTDAPVNQVQHSGQIVWKSSLVELAWIVCRLSAVNRASVNQADFLLLPPVVHHKEDPDQSKLSRDRTDLQ